MFSFLLTKNKSLSWHSLTSQLLFTQSTTLPTLTDKSIHLFFLGQSLFVSLLTSLKGHNAFRLVTWSVSPAHCFSVSAKVLLLDPFQSLSALLKDHDFELKKYADNTQLFKSASPDHFPLLLTHVEHCVSCLVRIKYECTIYLVFHLTWFYMFSINLLPKSLQFCFSLYSDPASLALSYCLLALFQIWLM